MSDAEFLNEAALLRCTKDELIQFIFELRKEKEAYQENDGKWWKAISALKQIDKFRDIYENCE